MKKRRQQLSQNSSKETLAVQPNAKPCFQLRLGPSNNQQAESGDIPKITGFKLDEQRTSK